MYGTTPTKRLFEMKKELMKLKKKMDKSAKIRDKENLIPMQYLMEYNFANANSYEIITSDGGCYAIDCETREFPNINFRRILYIRKQFENGNVYDTLRGNTDTSIYEIAKKFNVSNWVGYDRD